MPENDKIVSNTEKTEEESNPPLNGSEIQAIRTCSETGEERQTMSENDNNLVK